jgi:hypothetical protein
MGNKISKTVGGSLNTVGGSLKTVGGSLGTAIDATIEVVKDPFVSYEVRAHRETCELPALTPRSQH